MRIKNKIKNFLGQFPFLFFFVARFYFSKKIKQRLLLNKRTSLVIEGFPRSANTFSVVAFQAAQRRSVDIAHHLHVEAQILRGVKRGLPVLVLIRPPQDAVRSLLVMYPGDSRALLNRYFKFYSAVEKVKNQVVIADFSEVVDDFGAVIKKINAKFSTSYGVFEHSDRNVTNVFKEIERINDDFSGGKESHVSRPSKHRKNIPLEELDEYSLARAASLYNRLVN